MSALESDRSGEIARPTPFVIHGSFGKHLDQIAVAAATLISSGFATVIAPHDFDAIGQQDGFVLLQGQADQSPQTIEALYLEQVLSLRAQGGASLFVVPDGYIGKSAAYEAGVAQACGVRTFWTEQPQDVPFYVDPASIMSAEQLATYMHAHDGALPPLSSHGDAVAGVWQQLPFPTGHIAVGAVVRHGDRLLLVDDGRWGGRLTIPGTKVRAGEGRATAIGRLAQDKFGLAIADAAHLATSLAIPDSGYGGNVAADQLVFDDHTAIVGSDAIHPPRDIQCDWIPLQTVETMIAQGQVEPNAAALLSGYLANA